MSKPQITLLDWIFMQRFIMECCPGDDLWPAVVPVEEGENSRHNTSESWASIFISSSRNSKPKILNTETHRRPRHTSVTLSETCFIIFYVFILDLWGCAPNLLRWDNYIFDFLLRTNEYFTWFWKNILLDLLVHCQTLWMVSTITDSWWIIFCSGLLLYNSLHVFSCLNTYIL